MKAITYINKVITENNCSILTAEKLSEALKREGFLHDDLAVRFRPLFGDFDIMPRSWLEGSYKQDIKPYYNGTFDNPAEIIDQAIIVSKKYTDHINMMKKKIEEKE